MRRVLLALMMVWAGCVAAQNGVGALKAPAKPTPIEVRERSISDLLYYPFTCITAPMTSREGAWEQVTATFGTCESVNMNPGLHASKSFDFSYQGVTIGLCFFAEAREKGDLSENSEYDAAKEAQAHLEDKINKLKATISEAKVVDTSRLSTDSVQILTKVEMTNLTTNTKMSYTIVSENEADLRAGKISIKTPIAQGLLGKKVGDEVEITIPRGTIKLRIENISIA